MCEAMMFPETVEEWMEQYKMVDSDHVYSNGIEFVPVFRMKQWFEHYRNKSITTNADLIRAMSDEELARKFAEIEKEPNRWIAIQSWLEWLKSEA